MNDHCQFHRILLKLSGEALKGDSATPYSEDAIKAIASTEVGFFNSQFAIHN